MPTRTPPNLGRGILAIWNDYAPEAEEFYERWYMSEHFPERLAVPGFLRGRRHEAISADRKYFTFYELERPDVLFSPAYLTRLEAPTAWTEEVMRHWGNMFRTVCERLRRKGDAIGGFVAVARWEAAVEVPLDLSDRVLAAIGDPGVVAVDLWRASARQNAATLESSKRPTPDKTISAALIVEATRLASIEKVARELPKLIGAVTPPTTIGTYRLIALQDSV